MIPAQISASALSAHILNADCSFSSTEEMITPAAGVTNENIETRLTGLYLSRIPQSVYAADEMKAM